MKSVRILFVVCVVCVLVLAGLAFTSGVQTWAARRFLEAHPELNLSISSVSVGLNDVRVEGLRIERGGAILTLPSLEAELSPISAALNHRVLIHRLEAKGWTVNLIRTKIVRATAAGETPAAADGSPLIASARASEGASSSPDPEPAAFQGILSELRLPVDLSLDRVELEGDVVLPPAASGQTDPVRAHAVVTGGGLGAGREGSFKFTVTAVVAASNSPVNALTIDGTAKAAMQTPRSFSRLAVRADAAAQGPKLPEGARISAGLDAAQESGGETYTATLAGEKKELATIRGNRSAGAPGVTGTWKLNLSDGDLSPFTLGRALPSFEVVGQGNFGTGAALAQTHVSGELSAKVDRLNAIQPELSAVGPLQLAADFDLTHQGKLVRIDRLRASLTGSKPVLSAQGLQPFAFNTATGELQVADAARELLGVAIQGIPVEWAQPFFPGFTLSGAPVSGEFVASARNGGLALRSKSPLVVSGLSAARAGRPILRDINLSASISADFTPQGWQAELSPCAIKGLLDFSVKCGRLAGADQPIKATGRLTADLPSVLAQPAVGSAANSTTADNRPPPLVRGDLACDFTASLDSKRSIEAKLSISNLEADPSLAAETLPAISADIRADAAPDGKITFAIPLIFTREDRKSDVMLAGTLTAASGKLILDGQVTGARLVMDDLKILGAPFARPAAAAHPSETPPRPTAPLWAGVGGRLSLAVKKIESMKISLDDISGSLRIDPGSLHLENFHASLGQGGDVKMNAVLTFDAAAPEPYGLKADLAVANFDPAGIFRAIDPNQPPTVEGKFNAAARLSGSGLNPGDLASKVGGDCQVTSKGGVFRMLSTSISTDVQTASKAAAIGAFLGNMANAVGGVVGKRAGEFASAAQAVADFAKAISPIQYDQLSVEITRDASFNTVLKDFTLIAPELRLAGTGQVTYQPDTSIPEQPLLMEFKLRVRGHMADAMKFAGVLDAQTDELGYAACNLPLKVKGTLEKPDTSEVRAALMNLGIQRGGNLLDKFFGK